MNELTERMNECNSLRELRIPAEIRMIPGLLQTVEKQYLTIRFLPLGHSSYGKKEYKKLKAVLFVYFLTLLNKFFLNIKLVELTSNIDFSQGNFWKGVVKLKCPSVCLTPP